MSSVLKAVRRLSQADGGLGGLGWRHCARANGTDLQLNLTERVITRTAIANPKLQVKDREFVFPVDKCLPIRSIEFNACTKEYKVFDFIAN